MRNWTLFKLKTSKITSKVMRKEATEKYSQCTQGKRLIFTIEKVLLQISNMKSPNLGKRFKQTLHKYE